MAGLLAYVWTWDIPATLGYNVIYPDASDLCKGSVPEAFT